MIPNNIINATDADGRLMVGVLLSNRPLTTWLDKADFERIAALHPEGRWSLNTNGTGQAYVRIREPGRNSRNIYPARLIAGDFERTGVKYRDGDRLNLRQVNLYHDDGRGRCPNRVPNFRAFRIDVKGDAVHV